jgi:O-antigen ligase/polysaccharide polymerase Wzy-like membrane protein
VRSGRAADVALLVSVFTITLVRLRWPVGGNDVYLSDLTVAAFLGLFLIHRLAARDRNVPRTVVVLLAFLALLSLVYLVGYFNLETSADRSQFTKGLAKFALHFAFLIAAVAHMSRRSQRFYWQTLGAFVAGMALNGIYAVLEFLYAMSGRGFLDPLILGPITGDTSEGISRFGVVAGIDVYRSNGLMLDVNHLGVALIVPILILLPIYLRLERGHPMRVPLVLTLGVLALGEVTTLSRSGALGLVVGLLVLAIPYRRLMASRRLLVPVGALAGILLLVSIQYSTIVSGFLRSRTNLGGRGTQTHFDLYELLAPALDSYPFFGRGLNTFSVYFEFLTGRDNWGPHSYYIAVLVETGIVGAIIFLAFMVYVFRRLDVLRGVGRALAAVGDVTAARVQPLAWGLTAALAGTLAANVFYLTMQMYYFFVLLLLAVAAPVVFSRR